MVQQESSNAANAKGRGCLRVRFDLNEFEGLRGKTEEKENIWTDVRVLDTHLRVSGLCHANVGLDSMVSIPAMLFRKCLGRHVHFSSRSTTFR